MAAIEQVLTVAQMRAAEQALIDGGETVESLMERAGKGAAEWVWRMAGERPVTVLCGPGNNGGDGYVIARELHRRSVPVAIVAPLDPATEAARAARATYEGAFAEGGEGAVLVDCLFGSGLTRPLSAELQALVNDLAARHPSRIAIDLPSGIESDSGRPLNDNLPDYQLTISLGAWKFAHWLMPAMAKMGERRLIDIGVTPVPGAARMIARPQLSAPPRGAHKYSRGLLAVVGGAMPGAGMLAARAAMHGGAGYVKLFAEKRPATAPDELVVDTSPLAESLAEGFLEEAVQHWLQPLQVVKRDDQRLWQAEQQKVGLGPLEGQLGADQLGLRRLVGLQAVVARMGEEDEARPLDAQRRLAGAVQHHRAAPHQVQMAVAAVPGIVGAAAQLAGKEHAGTEAAALQPGEELGVFGRMAWFFGQKIRSASLAFSQGPIAPRHRSARGAAPGNGFFERVNPDWSKTSCRT